MMRSSPPGTGPGTAGAGAGCKGSDTADSLERLRLAGTGYPHSGPGAGPAAHDRAVAHRRLVVRTRLVLARVLLTGSGDQEHAEGGGDLGEQFEASTVVLDQSSDQGKAQTGDGRTADDRAIVESGCTLRGDCY